MLKLVFSGTLIAAALGLAGCASHPCRNALSYRDAQAHATPVIPRDLTDLQADPAYQIPPGKISKTNPSSREECVVYPPQVVNPKSPPKKSG